MRARLEYRTVAGAITASALVLGAPVTSRAATVSVGDLLRTDALGFVCIAEAELEVAWGARGKGTILPQTCFADPCVAPMTYETALQHLGRPPTAAEWDALYASYADHCRAEVIPFREPGERVAFRLPPATPVAPPPGIPRDPIPRPPVSQPPGTPVAQPPGTPVAQPPERPPEPPFVPDPEPPTHLPPEEPRPPAEPPTVITPVPLPAGAWLLALALGALAAFGRVRRRA